MTRVTHHTFSVGVPVYAIEFVTEDIIIYAGGGGASRSGVANVVVSCSLRLEAITAR